MTIDDIKLGPHVKAYPTIAELRRRTELAPDAPAPATRAMVAEIGPEPAARALEAWNARVQGVPIIDVAHQMGLTIETAKKLLQEVHTAIYEDLKANVDLNRQIDLHRIDQIIATHLPVAKAGSDKSAQVVLRAIQQRAQLTGQIAEREPSRGPGPQNVFVWLQQQLPSINQIVDALPIE